MKRLLTSLFLSTILLAIIIISDAQAQMAIPGNALKFDGIDDNVDTHFWANPTLLPQFTVECWVKGTNAPGGGEWNGPIYGFYGFGLYWDHAEYNRQGSATISTTSYTWRSISFGTLQGGVWYHLAATWDGRYFRAYKNGVQTSYCDFGYNSQVATDPSGASVKIGSHAGPPASSKYFFDGYVDEVRVWNVARTETQIRSAMYNQIPSPYPANLLIYYNFNYTSGATLPNLVSSNYTGTLTSNPTWQESYAMVIPTALQATNVTKRTLMANWAAPQVGTVEKYFLDVSTDPNFYTFITGYNNKDVGNTLSYLITGLNPNTTYYYRVRAYKASAGYSVYSNTISLSTPANRPPIANAGTDQVFNCAPKNGVIVTLNGSGSGDPDNDLLVYTWTKNGTTIANGPSPTINLSNGVHTIRLTVNDGDGGFSFDDVIVTVNIDNIAPIPNIAQLPTITGECSVSLIPPTATDNCSGTITAATSQPLFYSNQGTYTVTWTYTDANGNSAQQNQTVIVKDVTPPILQVPGTLTVYRNSPGGYSGSIGTAAATDNCTSSPVITNDSPQLFPLGTTKVTWKATDAVGNYATAEQLVNIVNRPPIANAGIDQQFGCTPIAGVDMALNGSSSSDPDGDALMYTWKENGNLLAEGVSPNVHLGDGTHTIVLKVTDGLGGESEDQLLISVQTDKEAPIITPPQDLTVETNLSGEYNGSIGTASAVDACEGQTVVTNNAPQTFPVGITNVTWTSKDSKGNTSNVIQKVTVITRPPVAIAGSDQKFDCALKSGVTTHFDASASHDPDNDPLTFAWMEKSDTIAVGVKPEVHLDGGVHAITLIINDGLGGKATDEIIVTVNIDTIAPKITAPDAVIKIANIAGGYSGEIGSPATSDNCGGVLAITNDALRIFPLGITKVIWKATDANGNSSTSEQTVTVNPIPVTVDVKPGSNDNPINLKSNGKIPVAILSLNGFLASSIDMLSVKFGPNRIATLMGNLEDVNSDGAPDLMLHFDNQSAGIAQADTKVELTGKTIAGVDFKGSDKISIVGKLKKDGTDLSEIIPTEYSVSQNYPNPFNPTTEIIYGIPEPSFVDLVVYNIVGQEVGQLVKEFKKAGYYSVTWTANNLPSGVYFYRITAGHFIDTKKMILTK